MDSPRKFGASSHRVRGTNKQARCRTCKRVVDTRANLVSLSCHVTSRHIMSRVIACRGKMISLDSRRDPTRNIMRGDERDDDDRDVLVRRRDSRRTRQGSSRTCESFASDDLRSMIDRLPSLRCRSADKTPTP